MTHQLLKHLLSKPWALLCLGMIFMTAVYLPGAPGGWLFDDYPNIVDNAGVRMTDWSLPSLARAALSSPSSDLKRPLASLSFAINYYFTGYDPAAMKITNIVIHGLNGVIAFLFLRSLLSCLAGWTTSKASVCSAAIASAWLVLPINLTGVLYVVQRMESLANIAVLLGLWAYVAGRSGANVGRRDLSLAFAGLLAGTAGGLLLKETAILTPLYALLIEFFVFRARVHTSDTPDRRIVTFFLLFLALPLVGGLCWLLPGILRPETWATRNFTLQTRLMSEARIVVEYAAWTLLPNPSAISFYHDDFKVSTEWTSPLSTIWCALAIALAALGAVLVRRETPLIGLGIGLYLACHSLTATILPLELIYEHRNYFASLGLLLAVAGLIDYAICIRPTARRILAPSVIAVITLWGSVTAYTAYCWGDPLRLAVMLAERGPKSPRAQYELGRTYVIYSGFDRASPFVGLARKQLERAAAIPNSSILSEQALIFLNSRLREPINDAWWDSMVSKLSRQAPTIQDESSLEALSSCLSSGACVFDKKQLLKAFLAALAHPTASARLHAMYADFAWNTLRDRELAIRMEMEAVSRAPGEPAYRSNLARYAMIMNRRQDVLEQLNQLKGLNVGGRLDSFVDEIDGWLKRHPADCHNQPAEHSCQDD